MRTVPAADDDPYDVLVDLLDEGRPAEVVHLSRGPFDPDTERGDARDAEDDLRRRLDAIARDLTRSFGEPRFWGGPDRPGFPSWSTAAHLALWAMPDEDLAAYVALQHGRPWDPVELRLGVR